MNIPILLTKLNKPQPPSNMVSKESLLDKSEWAKMILVSAQAGSGKSTLVSTWLSDQSKAYAWYSLDEWDNDLMQFFTYLIAAIKPIDDKVFKELQDVFSAFGSIGFDAFLKVLISKLHEIIVPYILIIDDYHVVTNDFIHQVIKTILNHFPPLLQIILITREDPPFPLAKMRASNKLLELRISQLRFSDEQIKEYFLKQNQISLNEKQVQLIDHKTEGWIAGLQMMTISMQEINDIASFIDSFSKSHYYVMDYLLEEVLEQQSPNFREFLLKTSILDMFSDKLCDAVVQLQSGSSKLIIEKLVKKNCFIISTEFTHKWFRYHHLFKDILRQRLESQPNNEIKNLHQLAAIWFETNGYDQKAIYHFLEASDFENAANIIENKWNEMDTQLQSASWLEMTKKLPSYIIEKSPILTMGYGWALLDKGDIEASIIWFEKSEKLYNIYKNNPSSFDVIINAKDQFDLLPATIASAYGYIAAAKGDVEGVLLNAHYALELIPDNLYFKRATVEMLIGLAHWSSGDLAKAETVIVHSFKNIQKANNPIIENSYYMVIGELYIQQDNLFKAKSIIEHTILKIIEEKQVLILLPSLYLSLAKIAYLEKNNKQAHIMLELSKEYGHKYSLMDWKYKYYLLLSRIYFSEKMYDLALDSINKSKDNYYPNPIPEEVDINEVVRLINTEIANYKSNSFLDNNENVNSLDKKYINQTLSEPLTQRELEVLKLIVSGLSNQEICDTLFLALSTVKGYNQNIFEKLQVNSRSKAVVKAVEIGLV